MMNWHPYQWPTDDLSELEIERFSYPLDEKDADWNALILPSKSPVISHVWLQSGESSELFCTSNLNFYINWITSGRYGGVRKAQDVCSDSIDKKAVARIYFLNASGELRKCGEVATSYLIIRSSGRGAWRVWDDNYTRTQYDSFHLFVDIPLSDFMRYSALDIWEQYQEALNDPQSEVSFARLWPQKTEAEQEDMLWNWPRPEREKRRREFEMWLRYLMWNQDSIWQNSARWNLFVSYNAQGHLFIEDPQEENTFPNELQNAISQLWRSFAPLNEEVLAHKCAFHSLHNFYDLFHIEVDIPNQHERLEAMLRWRDWQEEHGE